MKIVYESPVKEPRNVTPALDGSGTAVRQASTHDSLDHLGSPDIDKIGAEIIQKFYFPLRKPPPYMGQFKGLFEIEFGHVLSSLEAYEIKDFVEISIKLISESLKFSKKSFPFSKRCFKLDNNEFDKTMGNMLFDRSCLYLMCLVWGYNRFVSEYRDTKSGDNRILCCEKIENSLRRKKNFLSTHTQAKNWTVICEKITSKLFDSARTFNEVLNPTISYLHKRSLLSVVIKRGVNHENYTNIRSKITGYEKKHARFLERSVEIEKLEKETFEEKYLRKKYLLHDAKKGVELQIKTTTAVLQRQYRGDVDWAGFERHQLDGLNTLFNSKKLLKEKVIVMTDTTEEESEKYGSDLSDGLVFS